MLRASVLALLLLTAAPAAALFPLVPGDPVATDNVARTVHPIGLYTGKLHAPIPELTDVIGFDHRGDLIGIAGTFVPGDTGSQQVVRVDPSTGVTTPVITDSPVALSSQNHIAVGDGDELISSAGGGFTSRLWRWDLAANTVELLFYQPSCVIECLGGTSPEGIARAPGGNVYVVFVVEYGLPPPRVRVFELDPVAETGRLITAGGLLDRPAQLRVGPDGALLIAERFGGLVRVDPVTGKQSWAFETRKASDFWRFDIGANGLFYVAGLSTGVFEADPFRKRERLLWPGSSVRSIAVAPGAAPAPACGNGLDDDGDGLVDFPNDPGCESLEDGHEGGHCEDGLDNDRDGDVDLDDPGCEGDEPHHSESPQCSNGIDDDGDGLIDVGDDPGCLSPADNTENYVPPPGGSDPPPACGLLGIGPALVLLAAARLRRRRRA